MKRKPFPPQLLQKFHFVFILCLSLLLLAGCNNDPKPEPKVEDWLNLTIKFKDSSTQVIRDIALRTIENYIADTIKKMNDGDYKDFHPMFVRTSDPRDSLTTRIAVGFRDEFGVPKMPIPTPEGTIMAAAAPCLCHTECKICRVAKTIITAPMPSVPAFSVNDYIISADTKQENPKDTDKKNE